jgi:hypothetical protein
MFTLVNPLQARNALAPILVTLSGMTTLVKEGLPKGPPILKSPNFFTAYPPNSLGIVTSPVAVEDLIVAPSFSTM